MLWNWYTIDACFISSQWHIRSAGGYVGTIIGVFLITIGVEFVRRLGREYDRRIVLDSQDTSRISDDMTKLPSDNSVAKPFRPTLKQQAIRSFFHFVQFSASYILMLTAMYYNGGLIIAIFIGSYVGFFASNWDTLGGVTFKDACC